MTPWTAARQAPLSIEFSRQEYWNGWSFPSLICDFIFKDIIEIVIEVRYMIRSEVSINAFK